MARDLPKKLRLTLSALGCRTQKELLGKLLTVNPQTAFTPDKAYKWMSGAATPRDPAIYADLAAALGLDGGAAAFRDGALEAFEAALRARHPHLALAADASSAEVATRSTTVHACFSPAWSVTKSSELVIGTLELRRDGDRTMAGYGERHDGVDHVYAGELHAGASSRFGLLLSEDGQLSVYLCLNPPSRAGTFLGGVLSGAALNDPFTRPCACRIGCLRIETAETEAWPTGYVAGVEGLAGALSGFGIAEARGGALAEALLEVLEGAPPARLVQMPLNDVVRIETLLFQAQDRPPA